MPPIYKKGFVFSVISSVIVIMIAIAIVPAQPMRMRIVFATGIAMMWIWYWTFAAGGTCYHARTPINTKIARLFEDKMVYHPPIHLISRHIQSVFVELFGKRPSNAHFDREIEDLPDGGCVAVDYLDTGREGDRLGAPLVLLLPGLMGHTRSIYCQTLSVALGDGGFQPAVYVNRGLGGLPLKNPRAFSGTWCEDLAIVIDRIAAKNEERKIFLVGISLGTMILSQYLNEYAEVAASKIAGGLCISSAIDGVRSTVSLGKFPAKMLYNQTLTRSILKYAKRHADQLKKGDALYGHLGYDYQSALNSKLVVDFDVNCTAPAFGFSSVKDYYTAASPALNIPFSKVPLVFLQSADDPFSPLDAIPTDLVHKNKNIVFCVTHSGGHVGFLEGMWPSGRSYKEKFVVEVLKLLL